MNAKQARTDVVTNQDAETRKEATDVLVPQAITWVGMDVPAQVRQMETLTLYYCTLVVN